ncbi:MAG: transposase [Rhodospirillales bacterium]|nr:transposase [Rhodospirillales bacterium]
MAQSVLGDHRPDVWVSDRYAGQQDLGAVHQICLAHLLRDVQYAIDAGDTVFAPKLRHLLRWTIRVGRRRDSLADATLKTYHAKAERTLDSLVVLPVPSHAGTTLQRQVKAWRSKFFIFLQNRDVPPTNNGCERALAGV